MISSYIPEILLVCLLTILVGGVYVLDLRWWRPRLDRLATEEARLHVERLRREEAAGVPPSPTDYHHAISVDALGFTVTDLRGEKHETVTKRWADVCRGTAFKRDLFAVDCICLHLGLADDTGVELDEEMAGWNRFMEALPIHLPGCKPYSEWYSSVAFPAFSTNMTEIYSRATPRNAEQCARPNSHSPSREGSHRV